MRLNWYLIALLLLPLPMVSQVTISPDPINFFTVFTGDSATIQVTVTNNTPTTYVATEVGLWESEAFSASTNGFSVAPGGTFTFDVKCKPVQNVRTGDQLIIRSSSHPVQLNAFVFAFVRHVDSYYDLTFDVWHEDLKSALSTLTSFGYTDLGYNPARDRVFMDIDNEAANGQGAAQNTLTCPYTGTQAVGYTTRPDAQTTFNFNTEHTFPQGLFNQIQPMRSDMHHLFAVTENSNTQRSSKPFGVVSNPTWQDGGAKANGSTFEPRDAAKGDVARAMMYFVIRYQDYNGFFAGQEAILRQWNKQFPPDSVDINRNTLVESYQNVRNPFVDHPEFCDRIASIASTNTGPTTPEAWFLDDTLNFGDVPTGNTSTGTFVLSNQGFGDLTISNISTTQPEFTVTNSQTLFERDDYFVFEIEYAPTAVASSFAEAVFTTNDPNHPEIRVPLEGAGVVTSRPEIAYLQQARLYPTPATEQFRLTFDQSLSEALALRVVDLNGRVMQREELEVGEQEFQIPVRGLAPGMYLVELEGATGKWTHKLLVQ